MASDDDLDGLKRRLRRLEAMLSFLLVNDADDDPEFLDFIYYRVLRPNGPADEYWYDLFSRLRKRGSGPTLTKLTSRVERLEGIHSEDADWRGTITGRINQIDAERNELQIDTHRWLVLQSLGISLVDAALPRFVQVRVRLVRGNQNNTAAIVKAVERLLQAFGFDIADDFPERRGSWFKDWFAKSKEFVTQPEVADRLAKVERAVELHQLGKVQSEIDKNQAEAVAALLNAIPKDEDAAMQVGSVLLIHLCNKGKPGNIQVRTLSQREMILLEQHQDLLSSPRDLLVKLSDVAKEPTKNLPTRAITFGEDE